MKLIRVALAIAVALSVAATACGGKDVDKVTLPVGILTDFTGPAVSLTTPLVYGFIDGMTTANESGSIPGLELEGITYDQRSQPGRVPGGYVWLRGQGAEVMMVLSPTDRTILADRFAADETACLGFNLVDGLPNHPWMYDIVGSMGHDAEAAMMYIKEKWDYAGMGRNPRVGLLGFVRETEEEKQRGVDRVLALYPDKFDWVGAEMAPITTKAWAVEVANLKGCDYIYMAATGPGLVSFMREARDRGYEGSFVGDNSSFAGFFGLARLSISADQLYGCHLVRALPMWNEEIPFVNTVRQLVQRYRPDKADGLMSNTGYVDGVMLAQILADAVKRAVANVGAENVDGTAMRDALRATDIDMSAEGFLGGRWHYTEDFHCLTVVQKAYDWNVVAQEWEAAPVGLITPPSLAR